MQETVYDVLIIGGGPAGLTAAIYATRAGLTTLLVEKNSFGGQITLTDVIDNYPGLENVTGAELSEKLHVQAQNLGAQVLFDEITGLKTALSASSTCTFTASSYSGDVRAKTVIFAGGAYPKRAGFDGEEQYAGHGVSYCAVCDGAFYKDKHVFVVGGGNTACEEALYLSKLAASVTLIVRKDHLRAMQSLKDKVAQNDKIKVRYLTRIFSLEGEMLPKKVTLENTTDGSPEDISFDGEPFGVFVSVGRNPETELVKQFVNLDANGFIQTSETMATATPGLFAAGDVRSKELRQIVTATADGAIAANSAAKYIDALNGSVNLRP